MPAPIGARRMEAAHIRLNGGGVSYNPITALGSKLVAWWTADDLSSLTIVNTDRVSEWRDQVAGYAAVQAVNSQRPAYQATGFNGAPCVRPDGLDDFLNSSAAGLLAAIPSGSQPGDIWAVAEQTALTADTTIRCIASHGNNTAAADRRLRRNVTSGVNRANALVGDGSGLQSTTNSLVNLSSRHAMRLRTIATDARVDVDGVEGPTASMVPNTTNTAFCLFATPAGTTQYWDGAARDILLTNGTLTPTERADLEAWAMSRRRV